MNVGESTNRIFLEELAQHHLGLIAAVVRTGAVYFQFHGFIEKLHQLLGTAGPHGGFYIFGNVSGLEKG